MSQRLSVTEAMALRKGTRLYHNVIVFTEEDGSTRPATAVVTGKAVKCDPFEFRLPIRREYGDLGAGSVSGLCVSNWRTDKEKEEPAPPARVRRVLRPIAKLISRKARPVK